MRFFYDLILFIKDHYFLLLVCLLLIVINDAIIISDVYSLKTAKVSFNETIDNNKDEQPNNLFKVDIKGYVKKPGVYEVSEGMNINDLINLSGGLKKGATTKNINLSKKLTDQMVVIVSSVSSLKSKYRNSNILNEELSVKNDASIQESNIEGLTQTVDSNEISNKKININTASINELLTLTGIGESKAKAIIEYRNTNLFTNIDEIKNISGIGDSLFEKIKDSITI